MLSTGGTTATSTAQLSISYPPGQQGKSAIKPTGHKSPQERESQPKYYSITLVSESRGLGLY